MLRPYKCCSRESKFRARAFMAAVPLRDAFSSNSQTSDRRSSFWPANSHNPCNAWVFTMELRTCKYSFNRATARHRSWPVNCSRGIISAICHCTSCCGFSSASPRISDLKGCKSSGLSREIFSAASAARMRITVSSLHIHSSNSGNNRGLLSTKVTTELARPRDRRSPPANMGEKRFRGVFFPFAKTVSHGCKVKKWRRAFNSAASLNGDKISLPSYQ